MKKKNLQFVVILTLTLLFTIMGCTASPAFVNSTDADYANTDNWLALPSELHYEADVIYFYPTTYISKSSEAPIVADLADEGMRKEAQIMFKSQATTFETVADIYAPFYR